MTRSRIGGIVLMLLTVVACRKDDVQQQDNRTSTMETVVEPQAKNSTTTNGRKFEIGGSNYPTYNVQNYLNGGAWNAQNLQLTIGDYHLDPTTVQAQLKKMYDSGQRKIALPLWYSVYSSNITGTRTKHLVKINGGDMSAQHKQNLQNLINDIKAQGYNEICVRFMQQWLSNPKSWTNGWEETTYQQNWNFIVKTVNAVNSQLANSNIRVTYDLGGEMGGITRGESEAYVRRLWRDYNVVFGNVNTVGFTLAYNKTRLSDYITNLKSTNIPLPLEYALDIYSDDFSVELKDISDVLIAHNEQHKNVIIQETHYDDPDTFEDIIRESINNNLRIRTIYQWPIDKGLKGHFSMNFPEKYRVPAYIINAGSGCADKNCIWILGHFFEEDNARIVIKDPDTYANIEDYSNSEITVYHDNSSFDKITLRLKTQYEKDLFATKGLRALVVNSTHNSWSGNTMLLIKQ